MIDHATPHVSSRNGHKPTHVVIHVAEGTAQGCIAWFADPSSRASSHYLVAKDGTIYRFADEELAAWANGAVREPRILLPSTDNPNLWTISIEHEGYTGEPWTPEMYQADAWLLRGICERWDILLDRQHVIGHCDLDSVTRANCPGTGLDLDRLLRLARGENMNERLARLLHDKRPNRRGAHGTGNAYDAADYYHRQIDTLKECRIDWLKLVVAGDSGVQTCKALVQAGIIPIVRPYNTACPSNTIDHGLLQPYLDVGVLLFESPMNEFYAPFENQWGATLRSSSVPAVGGTRRGEIKRQDLSRMTWPLPALRTFTIAGAPANWPEEVARGWAQFAQIVLQAGGIPTTPSIETWHYETVFEKLFAVLCSTYADLLKQSVMALHNRPLNHPIAYSADPGGFLGWMWCDAYVSKRIGSIPIISTEAGPEPGWSQDANYPRVTPELHAQMWQDMLSWPLPDYYLAHCGWLWEGDGAWDGARWRNNHQHMGGGDLPVLNLLKTWHGDLSPEQPEPPEPEFPDELPDAVADLARQTATASMATFPWGIKYALRHGLLPFGAELVVDVAGTQWYAQPVHNSDGDTGLVVFPAGGYTDAQTRIVDWEV